jgi:hypothetical protein
MKRKATRCVARAAPKQALGTSRAIEAAEAFASPFDATRAGIVVAMLPPMT